MNNYIQSLQVGVNTDTHLLKYTTEFNGYTIDEIIKFPLFILQRDIDETNIKNLERYFREQIEFHEDIFFPIPFIIAHSENKLKTKKFEDSTIVLIDGQHRLQAIKNIKQKNPDLYEKIKNNSKFVQVINAKDDIVTTKAYLDIHKQRDLDYCANQFNKQDISYNSTKIIDNFVEMIITELKNNNIKVNENEIIKKHTFKTFYKNVFRKKLKNDVNFSDFLSKYKITSNNLYSMFVDTIKNKITTKSKNFKYFGITKTQRQKFIDIIEDKQYENLNMIFLFHYKSYDNIITDFINENGEEYYDI
jgi:hypothetical protein